MNGAARLFVTHGLHAGASIGLAQDRDVVIGSASEADLMLVDAPILPLHATVRLTGQRLMLRATGEGVTVFTRKLAVGRKIMLTHGAMFNLGDVTLQYSTGAPLSAVDQQRSERAMLFRQAPLMWLRRQCARLPRYGWMAILIALLGVASWPLLERFVPRETPAPRAPFESPAFRFVHTRVDKASGALVYEGYVQTPADLGALTLAARARGGAIDMRVTVVDNMREQLSDYLDHYYRGAQIQADQPGMFTVKVSEASGFLQP